jgi:hypothetical protein
MRYQFTVDTSAVRYHGPYQRKFQNAELILLFKHTSQTSKTSNQTIRPSIQTVLTIVEMKALLPILTDVSHCTIFSGTTVIPSLMRYTIRAYDVASTAVDTSVS